MPRVFWTVPVRARLVLSLLAVLPCLPGLTFLLAGWLRDPFRSGRPRSVPLTAEYQRAAGQAKALYRAGGVTLGTGALCGVVVGWKITRRREMAE